MTARQTSKQRPAAGAGVPPCPCGHPLTDHSTAEQVDLGYPAGCTAIVHDDPNPLYLELCACKRRPWLMPLADAHHGDDR